MGYQESLEIQYEVNGLRSMRETRVATVQPTPHSHNEIEVLLLERGSGIWLMDGELVTLRPGSLIIFWAIRPHQLIRSEKNTIIHWLDIPLTVFMEWQLPDNLSQLLLAGNTVMEPDKSSFHADIAAFNNWHDDLKSPNKHRQRLALLEIQARLGRLAFRVLEKPSAKSHFSPASGLMNYNYFQKISQIADFVSKHFSEPIGVPDIARAISMHPTSATKLFKKLCGMNLVHYLAQHRIYHAQRLLMTTDMKILDVALECGYQSASRFYAAFTQFCGLSPQEFRKSYDLRKIPLEQKIGVWKLEKAKPSKNLLMQMKKKTDVS